MLLLHKISAVGGYLSYCLKYLGYTPTLYISAHHDYVKKKNVESGAMKTNNFQHKRIKILSKLFNRRTNMIKYALYIDNKIHIYPLDKKLFLILLRNRNIIYLM